MASAAASKRSQPARGSDIDAFLADVVPTSSPTQTGESDIDRFLADVPARRTGTRGPWDNDPVVDSQPWDSAPIVSGAPWDNAPIVKAAPKTANGNFWENDPVVSDSPAQSAATAPAKGQEKGFAERVMDATGVSGAIDDGLAAGAKTRDYLSTLFDSRAPKDVDPYAPLKGAAAGIGAKYTLPVIGKGVAMLPLPYARPVGLALQAAGKIGPIVSGVAGAASSAAGEVAQVLGASKATQLLAELAGGGVGQLGASFAGKASGSLMQSAYRAGHGDFVGAWNSIKRVATISAEEKASAGAARQVKKFGPAETGRIEGEFPTVQSSRLQNEIRAADPSIPTGKPASEHYRENMFAGVNNAVARGKTFSSSPAFADLKDDLAVLAETGKMTKADASTLLQTLRSDASKNPRVSGQFAQTIDNQIRNWGASAEKGGATGARAVGQNADKEVRESVRAAYQKYTESIGLGDIERKYRGAYSAEKTAEAKDKIPYLISKFGTKSELDDQARNLARDPESKALFKQGIRDHLANVPPEKIGSEFNRIQILLVRSGVMAPKDLRVFAEQAKNIETVLKKGASGDNVRMAERFKRMVIRDIAVSDSMSAQRDQD